MRLKTVHVQGVRGFAEASKAFRRPWFHSEIRLGGCIGGENTGLAMRK